MSRHSSPEEHHLYIRSRRLVIDGTKWHLVRVQLEYSEEDWKDLVSQTNQLGFRKPLDMLEERIKAAIRTPAPTSRVRHAADRRRLYDGYTEFVEKFTRYLIFSHLTVLAGSFVIDLVTGSGSYVLFYWIYLLSLVLAVIGYLLIIYKGLLGANSPPIVVDGHIRLEVVVTRASELLVWFSCGIFGLTVLARIALGILQGLSFLNIPAN